ncbi:hypothetical protein D9611_008572 [Ephemerocybe angulata]|uniref:BPL/LPL catalytic domain-containing protein n=1 Tax=Ephemerocybe angulata TaxID=980116 RepID=A0A8H5AYQ6_9AGAR|nr:hypothetical protein D9611_008572 [Tulosesus angulatus]
MNVLVYSGSEVNPKSLDGTLDLLRSVCLPNYTVQPLTKASFINEPWKVGCALFVLPGLNPGAASSDVDIFGPNEVQKLREFVEQDGGAFLGLGLGARFEEQQGGFEGSLSGLSLGYGGQSYINEADQRAPLRFLDKGTKTSVFPVAGKSTTMESYAESEGSRVKVEAPLVDATLPGAEGQSKNLTVLATSSSSATIAGHASIGKGTIALTRIYPESDEPTLHPLIRSLLTALKLQLPSTSESSAPADLSPLPQFLTSIPAAEPKPIVTHLLRPFFPDAKAAPFAGGTIKDVADTFAFLPLDSSGGLPKDETVKHIIVCPDGVLPPKEQTPHFDLSLYYDTLAKLRGAESSDDPHRWNFGDALLYGERVTSTQSMFDKNPTLLSGMPTPVLSLAAQQLAGRGRGKNVWLSPEGCLQMSLLVRVKLDPGGTRTGASTGSKTGKTTSGAKTTATEGAKTTKTEGAKTTKTDSSGIPKTTKTESSATPKTTKTESTGGPKSTKTSSTESTKTTTSQLKSNPVGPDTKTAKTSKTNTSGAPDSAGTKTSSSELKGTKTTEGTSPLSSGFSQPLLERLASAFASPEEVAHPNPLPYLGASKLVFVQYLFALAVCEACRLPEVLGPELGKRVRIKWPNDLYLDLSELGGPRELKKIGGILVNTNFAPGGKVDVVIGCGLNVLNKPPISSLSQLVSHLHAASPEALSLERTAAAIMISFERLWTKFTSAGGSFEPFLQAYYAVWLHTDQRVTVTTTVPPTKARIVGITPDYGLLRTVRDDEGGDAGWDDRTYGRFVYGAKEGGKEYIDLQPDGNSFDLMANLIKAKTT